MPGVGGDSSQIKFWKQNIIFLSGTTPIVCLDVPIVNGVWTAARVASLGALLQVLNNFQFMDTMMSLKLLNVLHFTENFYY